LESDFVASSGQNEMKTLGELIEGDQSAGEAIDDALSSRPE
jgi:hypothetical protein